jgi:hypothetical protein
MQIMKSALPAVAKYPLILAVGAGAFAAYFGALVILATMFPGLVKPA